ncbi:protein kinase domain-containing protein [Fibrella arboris]|uniref:protein kinase domain-containing protein n=1 Tax=Fibrella arboris TaxID=3242486 RepID=UPI003522D5C9
MHRDLKAGNVKLLRPDSAKLLDFGLARLAHAPRPTRQGYLAGTVSSMAPEQFTGESAPASDCWALGGAALRNADGLLAFWGEQRVGNRAVDSESRLPATNPAESGCVDCQRTTDR